MLRDLDLGLLRAFTAVVDTGSVTAAARLLNRTQAAVSLQIKRLEDLLATPLFRREHRRLELTASGERFLASAQRMVALNDEVWGQITTPHFEGEVRLGVPTDIVPTYIPPILRRFNQAWPRVRVTLALGNSHGLLEKLDTGALDIALSTDVGPEPGSEMLRVDRLVWTGSPGSRAHELQPLPLAVGDQSCRFRPVALDALRKAGRDWRHVSESSHQVAQNAIVGAGIAVSAMLRDSVPEELSILGPSDGLPELPEFAINLYLPRLGASDIAAELARHVRAEFVARFGDAKPVLQIVKSDRAARKPRPVSSSRTTPQDPSMIAHLLDRWRRRHWTPDAVKIAAFTGLRPIVVITGGGDGIGRALAFRFARAGHGVLLIGRRPEPLAEAAAAITRAHGVSAMALPLDITAPDARAVLDQALAAHNAYCDILINNAGIGLAGAFLDRTAGETAQLLALNVGALTTLTHHVLPGMQTRGRGGILNIASLGGVVPGPYQAAYYASKAYVISLTEALAHESRGRGVRIATIAPGPVATDFHSRMAGKSALYTILLPWNSPVSVAASAYRGFWLGRTVIVPGAVHTALGFGMRLIPHKLLLPIIGALLRPRRSVASRQEPETRGNARRGRSEV